MLRSTTSFTKMDDDHKKKGQFCHFQLTNDKIPPKLLSIGFDGKKYAIPSDSREFANS